MSESLDLSRRRMIKFLSGAPLLPLAGASGASFLLAGCGGDSAAAVVPPATPVTLSSVTFSPMSAPGLANAAQMATTTVGSALSATFSDGSKQNFTLKYDTFFVTGAQVPDGKGGTVLSGGYYDINNKPIVDTTEANKRQFFSDCPDGTSLLKLEAPTVAGIKGNAVFAVVQVEYATRNVKGDSMYRMLPSPSYINGAMKDGSGGISIKGPSAGIVYALNLKAGQKDTRGAAIDSDWVPVDMAAVPALVGEDLATPDALGNLANADKIANPDGLPTLK
jgi:hypothetical protein